MVTVFYFIFVFIFALIGIHVIGGLDYVCVYKTLQKDGNYRYVYTDLIVVQDFNSEICNLTKFICVGSFQV